MKKFLLTTFLLVYIGASYAQTNTNYEFNYIEEDDYIYYEKIFHFENKNAHALKELTKKFLALEEFSIAYEDDTEIAVMGKLSDLKYRGFFLFIFNTTYYNGIYDMKIEFKENRIRVSASNFYLIPKNIKLNTYSWWGTPTRYGSSGWSTSKIPTEVPKRKIEIHYPNKRKPKYCIFPSLDEKMTETFSLLVETIENKKDEW